MDAWTSYTLLTVLLVAGIVLALTVPTATNRGLTFDIVCTSGNPVVGAWVESASGGSYWAQKGRAGRATAARFVFRQVFTGEYQVNVGCGGTEEQWGVEGQSARSSHPYRRLVCDDLHVPPSGNVRCWDQPFW